MLPCGFWHILRFQTPVTPAKGQLTEVSCLLRCGFSHSFTGSVQEVVQWMCRREALQAQPPDTPSSCETFTARRIYRLPPLPPTPPEFGFSDVMMICVGCWFSYVVNFICKAFVEIDLKNDIIV